ncbi:Clp protease ClpP [Clostridium sp. AF34-13]|jgi:ATP-dependent Clp protease protease subunit|uniref:ATP-dependent Clp protease proteolytic subunit n=1 Tax=Butyribacter intestini TaxID=1703332 RepID=A0AAW3JTI0_9FIRM|nr:head maturation protease, ClpP-related [Clostridium sp. AF34-13]KQC86207.1 peptidase S14 [Butyribacter intestini]RHP25836.1 Clp protease ClpP [Clostridium sp. AF34-13]RHU77316.1 Clp protease ClpP [Butyribacter intestini]DAK67976.1 MAG TPA: Putative ATP dependent Clp protease [Caudoviricetes sp.]
MKRKFWNWVKNEGELEATRTLFLNGEISDETWYGDEVTPQLFKDELNADSGDITVWINSPGGDVFAAAQIYNMLRDYKGHVTVKIDGLAASAASVIAVAGDTVLVSPVAMMMIHNPATLAMGNTKDMEAAIAMLNEVKESILNAYVDKTGLSRNKLSKMMDDETWFNAKKAVELGFADKVLFAAEEKPKKKPEEDEDPDEKEEGKEPGEDGEGDEDEKKKKFPFQNAYAYSRKSVADSFLNKVTDKAPETVPVDQLRKRLDLLKR